MESKAFVEFIALIIRSKIYTMLRKRMVEMSKKPNYMTVPAALRELEKIELIRQPGGHYKLDHAITATQKTILGAFGMDEEMARTKTTKSMDEKITETEEKLRKQKDRCDKISSELDKLYEEKIAMENQELLIAIKKSSETRAEIFAFLESK